MGRLVSDIRIEHRFIGTKHVFTSPDVKGLFVVHSDKERARNNIQSALDMLDRMEERIKMGRLGTSEPNGLFTK